MVVPRAVGVILVLIMDTSIDLLLGIGSIALGSLANCTYASIAITKIQQAKTVTISSLCSLVSSSIEKFVIVLVVLPAVGVIMDTSIDLLFLVGIALGSLAIYNYADSASASNAMTKIQKAKIVTISSLRTLISSSIEEHPLVFVRGFVDVQTKPSHRWSLSHWWSPSFLKSTGKISCIVLLKTQAKDVSVTKGGFLTRISDFRFVARSITTVSSFILAEASDDAHVKVNLNGGKNTLHSLTTIVDRFHSEFTTSCTFPLRSLFGILYPFGVRIQENFVTPPLTTDPYLLEEKILPLGKEINVVGICSALDSRSLEINPCTQLPYFLSDMTIDQMVAELAQKSNSSFRSAHILGSLSIAVLCYYASANILTSLSVAVLFYYTMRNRHHTMNIHQSTTDADGDYKKKGLS